MLGAKIKNLRKQMNLTQVELSSKLGIAQSTLGMIESNKRPAGRKTLIKLADFFGVTVDYLLSDDESYKEKKIDASIKKELPIVPKEFTNPDEARKYVNKHQIFGSNGFDSDKLDDKEILEFANELLKQMELISFKFKK